MSSEHNLENMDNKKPENTATVTNKEETSENLTISTENIQSNPSEINPGVVIKNTESQSLNSLCAYDSGSDIESSLSEIKKTDQNWRDKDDSDSEDSSEDSSSSSSSSTSSSSDSDDDDTGSSSEVEKETAVVPPQNKGAIKKNNTVPKSGLEWEYEHLPPVPDLSKLNITAEDESFVHMGNVMTIVDVLVTIEALPNTPAYNLDTILFLDNGKKAMGFIFDVFGPVTSPFYVVRFNSAEDIKNLGIQVNTKVYSAPNNEHTQYVFLQQLLKLKGSDASWVGDAEVPQEFADYSDDENECSQRYGNKKLTPHMKRAHSTENLKKHESMVNRNNALNTELNHSMDSCKPNRRHKAIPRRSQVPQMNSFMPTFDPSVPPPNYFYNQAGPPVHIMPNYRVTAGAEATNCGSGASQFTQGYPMNTFVYNPTQTNQTYPLGQMIPNYSVAPGTETANCSGGESWFTQSSSMSNFDPNFRQTNATNYFLKPDRPSQH